MSMTILFSRAGFVRMIMLTSFILSVALLPFSVSAASTASIDASTLSTHSSKPTVSGTSVGVKSVKVYVKKEGSTKTIFKSRTIKVKKDQWKSRITKKLSEGTYEITLVDAKKSSTVLATSTLTVGKGGTTNSSGSSSSGNSNNTKSDSTLVVSSVPLLTGGVARAGGSVPVSYLQVTNIGKETATLKGFWITQAGSSAGAVVGLSTVDDKGGSRASTGGTTAVFKNGAAFAPSTATLAPGEMKLFTIKAQLANNTYSYLGQQLTIAVSGLDTNAKVSGPFPIRGTTWTIAQ